MTNEAVVRQMTCFQVRSGRAWVNIDWVYNKTAFSHIFRVLFQDRLNEDEQKPRKINVFTLKSKETKSKKL